MKTVESNLLFSPSQAQEMQNLSVTHGEELSQFLQEQELHNILSVKYKDVESRKMSMDKLK